jgi:hypothetical protein
VHGTRTHSFHAITCCVIYLCIRPNTEYTVSVMSVSIAGVRSAPVSPQLTVKTLALAPATPPPVVVVTTTITSTTTTVTIKALTVDGSASVDSYVLTVRAGDSVVQTISTNAADITSTGINVALTGLTSNTAYTATLKAVSSTTTLSSAETTPVSWKSAGAVPDPPRLLTSAYTNTAVGYFVKFSWQPPFPTAATAGIQITGFTLVITVDVAGVQIPVFNGGPFSKLYMVPSQYNTPGATFTATITTSNIYGSSPVATFDPVGIPGIAPSIVSAKVTPMSATAGVVATVGAKILISLDRSINAAAATSQVVG